MARAPRDPAFDATPFLLFRDGYRYVQRRCRELGTDAFEGRLLLQKVVFLLGEEAASLFYDPHLFQRGGALPRRLQKSLLGTGGVHMLDDAAHQHRKQLFLRILNPKASAELGRISAEEWRRKMPDWISDGSLSLFEEAQEVLCRSACRWTGVPLGENEAIERSADFFALVDAFGAAGVRYRKGVRARRKLEAWAEGIVYDVRTGQLRPADSSPLCAIAFHRDLDGKLLDRHTAAVELLNLLRPIVAVSYLVAFCALALHEHPEQRDLIRTGRSGALERFVHEVRRYFPFAPALGARARRTFTWRGIRVPKGRLVILDLYGTNHDPRIWDRPEEFRPSRFTYNVPGPFGFVPQGGGDHATGHRCAGEEASVELMKAATTFLACSVSYEVPPQDFGIPMNRMPSFPRSGFRIEDVRTVEAARGSVA